MAYRVETLMERYHSLFVWYIAVRFNLVGLEYMVVPKEQITYWSGTFPGVDPHFVGLWLLATGAMGVISRIYCHQCWTRMARKFTVLFNVGVMLHSIYRIAVLAMNRHLSDPVLMLFLSDLFAVVWLQFQLSKWHYCHPACRRD
jgi:hypothetical protein